MLSKTCLAAAALALTVNAGFKVGNGEFNLRYIPETEQVEFKVTLYKGSWVGLVPGQGDMTKRGDMLLFFEDDHNSYFADYHSIGFEAPKLDMDSQDLYKDPTQPTAFDGWYTTLVALRALDTGDEHDWIIPLDEPFTLGYANKEHQNSLLYCTKHEHAGSVEITLKSDGTPVFGDTPFEAKEAEELSFIEKIFSAITQE